MKLATMFFPLRLDKPRRNASLGLNQVDFRRKFFVIWVATKPKLTTTCVVLFRVNKKKPLKRHSNCGWWLGTVNYLAHKSACNELLDPIRKLRALDCYWYKYRISCGLYTSWVHYYIKETIAVTSVESLVGSFKFSALFQRKETSRLFLQWTVCWDRFNQKNDS